jgi:c(7)-type cytochrome triheme protein
MAAALAAVLAGVAVAAPAVYGRVVINNGSRKAGLAPVVFDHWVHRARYTCRVCHVDIGFGMKAGVDVITAAENGKGLFCGVCHNGKTVFAACSADRSDLKRCERCHSQGKAVKPAVDFAAFTAKLPKDTFGNGVNWEKAAEDGTIKPVDFIEGVSIKKPAQAVQKDFTIKPKSAGMAEIIFSHKKHSAWNGCEVCHPEIFKQGATKYSMDDIKSKKFCGVCHGTVAFPQEDCGRCHSKPVK